MNWKRYLPAIVIGVVVLWLISRLSKGSGGGPNVYNALVPSGPVSVPNNRDSARVAAYSTLAGVGLGTAKLEAESKNLDAQIGLARDRFKYNLEALGVNNAGLLQRLQAELADRQYDRELQQRAIDQTFALAQNGQIGNQVGSILGALLNAIQGSRRQSPGSSGSGSSGSSSSGVPAQRRTIPQMSRAAYERLRQSALLQAIFGSADPTGSGPIGIRPDSWPGFDDPQSYSGVQSTLDWWSSLSEPFGSVTSSFDFIDPWYAASFDRSLPVYQPTTDELYQLYLEENGYGLYWE